MSTIPKEAIAQFIDQKVDHAVERRLSTSIFKKPKLPDWFRDPIETNNETLGRDNSTGIELFAGKEISLEKEAAAPEYSTYGFGLAGELSMTLNGEVSSQDTASGPDSSNASGEAETGGNDE